MGKKLFYCSDQPSSYPSSTLTTSTLDLANGQWPSAGRQTAYYNKSLLPRPSVYPTGQGQPYQIYSQGHHKRHQSDNSYHIDATNYNHANDKYHNMYYGR